MIPSVDKSGVYVATMLLRSTFYSAYWAVSCSMRSITAGVLSLGEPRGRKPLVPSGPFGWRTTVTLSPPLAASSKFEVFSLADLEVNWVSLLQQFFLIEETGNAKLELSQDGAVLRLGHDKAAVIRLVWVDGPEGPHHLPVEDILLAGRLGDRPLAQ